MGEVYKAIDTRLDRTVAIKVLAAHLAESPERKERFEREARTISKLNHPNICTLYDIGTQDGTDFLVMEYIEGEMLADRLTRGPLSRDEALEYAIQITDALAKAHRAGIVHRDLKPANIMLTKMGVKLLDFGLAKLVETESPVDDSSAPTVQKDLTHERADIEAGERSHRWPRAVPGSSDNVLFTVATTGSVDEDMIAVVSLETGHTRIVLEGGYSARATTSGHLVFGRGGDLLAKPIELDTLESEGAPVLVLENVSTRTNGAPDYDVSETGTLRELWDTSGPVGWVDAQGTFEAIMEWDGGPIWDAAISPDGERIAMTFATPGNTEIWTYDIARGTSRRLTFDAGEDFNPIWSPDGEWIAFASELNGTPPKLHRMRSGGSGTPEMILNLGGDAGEADVPTSWSPDGNFLTVSGYGDIWLVPLEEGGEASPLLHSEFHEHGANVSPDGNWLAYHSDESGRAEVYVQSFPGLGSKRLVSSEGGTWPQWDDSGRKLFYRTGNRMMQVDVAGGSSLTLSKPRVLFTGKYSYGGVGHSNYDLSKDGRFLMIRIDVPPPTTRVRLVTNWCKPLCPGAGFRRHLVIGHDHVDESGPIRPFRAVLLAEKKQLERVPQPQARTHGWPPRWSASLTRPPES